ncbi:hypothetical protein BJY59DRAFT_577344 [Rhodotorula toruloides]
MDEAGALPQPSAPQFPEPEDADASMPGSTTVVNPGSDTDSATSTSSRKTSAGSSPRPRSSTPVRLADFLANSKIKSTRTTGTSRTSNGARPRARSSAASSTRLSHDTLPDTRSASSFASSSRVQVEHPIFDAVHPAAAANVEAGRHQGGYVGAGGDGDDPFAYILHRMTRASLEFYPSEHVAEIMGTPKARLRRRSALSSGSSTTWKRRDARRLSRPGVRNRKTLSPSISPSVQHAKDRRSGLRGSTCRLPVVMTRRLPSRSSHTSTDWLLSEQTGSPTTSSPSATTFSPACSPPPSCASRSTSRAARASSSRSRTSSKASKRTSPRKTWKTSIPRSCSS